MATNIVQIEKWASSNKKQNNHRDGTHMAKYICNIYVKIYEIYFRKKLYNFYVFELFEAKKLSPPY